MFLGVYLVLSILLWFLSMLGLAAALPQDDRRLIRPYVIASAAIAGAVVTAMAAFLALSFLTGLMVLGTAVDWSYPGDYLSAGPVGWLIGALPAAGLLAAPAIALVSALRKRAPLGTPAQGS